MLGIIGGSGIADVAGLAGESVEMATPFGRPSAPVRLGSIDGAAVAFLPRHGEGHRFSPTNLPYRANIYALKEIGVDRILALSAVGSLREDLPPRSLVLPDQIIDRTVSRPRTFFDGNVVAHVGIGDPFCPRLRADVRRAAAAAGVSVESGGTYVCIEGPQFSTRAESELYRSWGSRLIGMTAMPEARLAREAELCYAVLALVTDYDVWHEAEADVSVEIVLGHLRANAASAAAVVRAVAVTAGAPGQCGCGSALDHAIMTDLERITDADRRRLGIVVGRVLDAASSADD